MTLGGLNLISVVIPHYPLTEAHNDAFKRCVASIRGADEIIAVVNDGMGFGPAMNLGVSLAKGDYVVLANNDLVFGDWHLEELCRHDAVTFPVINGFVQEFTGACLMIPRKIIQNQLQGQVYDERFKVGFWEDVDLWIRLKELAIPFLQLPYDVAHPSPGFTMRHMDPNQDFLNKQIFLEKHKTLPIKNWS